jgi:putative transposase
MYHLVWIPKYRKRLLEGKLAKRVEELIRECADLNGWTIHEMSIQPNHVHVMVQLKPNISLSRAVQYFKGGSSRVLRQEFKGLREFLWGDSFWADGYFAETSGQLNEAALRKYIQNQ